ncbi:MAG: elongation factor P [Patescibacteria group bacterium]|nr:elongation factor P [Patescibacteria group bacterium]
MATLSYSDIVPKKIITFDDGIYEVVSSHVARKDMGKPSNRTKLRNLKTGKVSEVVFHQAEKVEEADVEEREVKFIYKNRGEVWFCDPKNPRDRFALKEEVIGESAQFLKPDMLVEMREWQGELLGVHLPIKMDFKVVEAPPSIKGNTAQGGTKQATLEGGAVVNVPLFINEGDIVTVNTETSEYVGRAEKS